jgi:hypothetical protein
LISFLAGLTLIYPLVKTIQYFQKRREKKASPREKTPRHDDFHSSATPSISWCDNYTAGLTFLGYRNTASVDGTGPTRSNFNNVYMSATRP